MGLRRLGGINIRSRHKEVHIKLITLSQTHSAFLARRYAKAEGVNFAAASGVTSYAAHSTSFKGTATAAPAGLTCLKLLAAARPVASRSSLTRSQALAASRRLMYPGVPLRTVKGRSELRRERIPAGFWWGLHPKEERFAFGWIGLDW